MTTQKKSDTKNEKRHAARALNEAAKPPNRRGSPEAVEKRRVARAFNTLLLRRASRANSRGRKLLDSLDKPRKPFQLLQSIEELLELGYLRGDIRAALPISNTVTMPKVENPVMVTFLRKIHNLYGFRRETYLLAGFSKDVLSKAQIAWPSAMPTSCAFFLQDRPPPRG